MLDEQPTPEEEAREREREATWAGLPEDVRREALEKRKERTRLECDYEGLVWRYRWKYAVVGGFLAAAFGSGMGHTSALFLSVLTAYGAAAAFKIASARLDRLTAIGLYGGGSIVVSILGALTGGLHLNHFTAFWMWLILLCTSVLLAIVAKIEHGNRFGPF
jgi:hypothetical protein